MLVGLAVRGPVLGSGFAADDYGQLAMADGTFPVQRPAWSLFTFSSGDPREVQQLRVHGFLPWWSDDNLRLSVLRPLPSLLIAADRAVFGDNPLPYHLHSLLWWLCLCAAVAHLLHALLPARVALLALALYVLDESHTLPLGWLANRNSVLASLFAVLSLRRFIELQRSGRRVDAVACAALFSLSLACGEYALTFLGYFAALALSQVGDSAWQRLRQLAPVALPALIFVLLRGIVGGGTRGSGSAIEPLDRPLDFLQMLPDRLGALWSEAILTVRTDAWIGVWATAQGLPGGGSLASPTALPVLMVVTGVVGFGLLAVASRVGARKLAGEGPSVSWMLWGALWSTIPICATLPAGRNLLSAQLGIATIVAVFLSWVARRVAVHREDPVQVLSMVALLPVIIVLSIGQMVAAPLSASGRAVELRSYGELAAASVLGLGNLAADARVRRAYILQASDPTLMLYPAIIRAQHGRSRPESIYTLSGSAHPVVVHREDARSLVVSHPGDAPMLSGGFELMFRRLDVPMRPGTVVQLRGLRVEVLRVVEGRPNLVRFRFDTDLDAPEVMLLQQQGMQLVRVAPPAIGQHVLLHP